MIYVTGDTHGGIDFDKIVDFNKANKELTKKDYIIISGDFGFVWGPHKKDYDNWWLDWMDKFLRPTMLFVDGNHENHDMLDDLEQVDMFGGKVGKIRDSVYHLKRGYVYNIDGKSIFTFGGAHSIDKSSRVEGKSWWSREIPSFVEEDRGLTELEKVNNSVDYVITHEAPIHIEVSHHVESYGFKKYLNHICKITDFKLWVHGHHHIDRLTKFEGKSILSLYNEIFELEEYTKLVEKNI